MVRLLASGHEAAIAYEERLREEGGWITTTSSGTRADCSTFWRSEGCIRRASAWSWSTKFKICPCRSTRWFVRLAVTVSPTPATLRRGSGELDLKADWRRRPLASHLPLGPLGLVERTGGAASGHAHEVPVPAAAVAAELVSGAPSHVLGDHRDTGIGPR